MACQGQPETPKGHHGDRHMKYIYFECPDCGFDSIQLDPFNGSRACPLCAGDSGHDVCMTSRPAEPDDKPEGFDARKGTRKEQASAQG